MLNKSGLSTAFSFVKVRTLPYLFFMILAKIYAAWETDEIISMELYRNVALAFLCIFLTTLPLLSDLLGCAEVLLSVVLTMVNVSGLMHFWGKIFFSGRLDTPIRR